MRRGFNKETETADKQLQQLVIQRYQCLVSALRSLSSRCYFQQNAAHNSRAANHSRNESHATNVFVFLV